jgi:hypothetical protein
MNSRVDDGKTSWAVDRARINECLRRHPVAHFVILFSIGFTVISLLEMAWATMGFHALHDKPEIALPLVLAIVFVVMNRLRER